MGVAHTGKFDTRGGISAGSKSLGATERFLLLPLCQRFQQDTRNGLGFQRIHVVQRPTYRLQQDHKPAWRSHIWSIADTRQLRHDAPMAVERGGGLRRTFPDPWLWLYAPACVIVIFIVCAALEILRQRYIENPVVKWSNSAINKLRPYTTL